MTVHAVRETFALLQGMLHMRCCIVHYSTHTRVVNVKLLYTILNAGPWTELRDHGNSALRVVLVVQE